MSKVGRPTTLTLEVVDVLEDLLKLGMSITKACDKAGIDRKSYYTRLKEDPAFSYKMGMARVYLEEKARSNVAKTIEEGNVDNSKWFIDHEARKESRRITGVQASSDGEGITVKIVDYEE